MVIRPGLNEDILGQANGLCGPEEKDRADEDLQDRNRREEVETLHEYVSSAGAPFFIGSLSSLRFPVAVPDQWEIVFRFRRSEALSSPDTNSAPFPFLGSNMALSSWRVGGNASDYDGDVVRAAASVRQGDQDRASHFRIARFAPDAAIRILFHPLD